MNNRYEILAPAGTYETFLAVIQAGADAVYLGGEMFGARAYAGNLSEEEILKAIDYAHVHGKRVYLTVNTLLKNNELFDRLYDYLRPYYEAGLDGVIVQDYGVMKFVHDNFPDMEIHASTQMTITDGHYTDFLKRYNVTRIVPARELSLSDIKKLRAHTDMEIECFVHGALCYSYSGMCFMSSFIGGRSGNRGRCAQPCRLNYCDSNILSLKDLCTLDILPDILDAGVFSLKIEGRMKSPVYAAGVTSIYRKYVDLYETKGRNGYKVDKADKDKLLMLFDRGGMTDGYYVRHNGPEMIANENKSDKSLLAKEQFEKEISDLYLNKTLKEKINITASFVEGQKSMVTIYDYEGNCVTVEGDVVDKAINKAMSEEDIRKQLSKLGNSYFEADNIDIEISGDIFIPNKALNELRRKAVDEFSDITLSTFRRKADRVSYNLESRKSNTAMLVVRVSDFEQIKASLDRNIGRLVIECELFKDEDYNTIIDLCHDKGIECFLGLPRVFKGDLDWVKNFAFDGFYIRNMAEYQFIRSNGINGKCVADYTVYGFNDLSVSVLKEVGFDEVVSPIELNEKELCHLNNTGEMVAYGRMPLMISANCIDKTGGKCHYPAGRFGVISDRKNAKLPYVTACKYCYNVIYNSVPLFLIDKFSQILNKKTQNFSLCFTDENGKTTGEIIDMAISALDGNEKDVIMPEVFTRGHFTRGVE